MTAAAVVVLLSGGDDQRPRDERRTVATTNPPAPAPPAAGLVIGLTEQNPGLILPGDVAAEFAPWRDRVAALRPRIFRLLVDWSKVQPVAGTEPDWGAAQDGCLRGRPPCRPYAGIRDILRALRARQDADGGWALVPTVYGAPDWAKAPAGGCPAGGTIQRDAYEALLRSFVATAREERVRIAALAPWNEPNHPTFLAPQRSACDRAAPALSVAAYAELVRAAREVLPRTRLVLGDLAGYDRPRREAVAAAEFAAALPPDVACASDVWGQHAYIGRGATRLAADRQAGGHARLMAAVTAALDGHRCPRPHRIWVTETGATPTPRSCAAMDAALRAWEADPRIDVAVQYTFRQDTEFPVGLADARLGEVKPAYAAWLAWGGTRDPAGPAPAAPCGAGAQP